MEEKDYQKIERLIGLLAIPGRFFIGVIIGFLLWSFPGLILRSRSLIEFAWTWPVFLSFTLGSGVIVMLGGKFLMREIFGRWYNDVQ